MRLQNLDGILVIYRYTVKTMNLWTMQLQCEDTVSPGRTEQISHQATCDGNTRRVFLVRP